MVRENLKTEKKAVFFRAQGKKVTKKPFFFIKEFILLSLLVNVFIWRKLRS